MSSQISYCSLYPEKNIESHVGFYLQVYCSIPPGYYDDSQHTHRGGTLPPSHANSYKRGTDGDGTLWYVHDAVPRTLAFLHVHLWQSLQTAQSC